MARPIVFNWKASDTQAVCLTQSRANAGNLIIDGNEASQGISSFPGALRSVSLTSTNNLSGVNFTINGTYGNNNVSYTRTGPNNNTVQTTPLFSTVTSVTVDNAVNSVSIGSGNFGQTDWFLSNFQQTYTALTVAISNVAGSINVTAATTLDDVNTNPNPYLFDGIVLSSSTADGFGTNITPIRYSTILVTTPTTGSFTATFLQQGII